MCQESGDFGAQSPKRDIFNDPFLSRIYAKEEVERAQESELMTDSKETRSSRHSRTDGYMNSQWQQA